MTVLDCTKIFPLFELAFGLENKVEIFVLVALCLNLIFLIYIGIRILMRILSDKVDKTKFALIDDISSAFY